MSCSGIDSKDAGGQDALTARLAASGASYHNEPLTLNLLAALDGDLLVNFHEYIVFIHFLGMASFMLKLQATAHPP